MATFPSITPTYGAQKNSNPMVVSVSFGDAYEQRQVYGLNQDLKEWTLTWENITETQSDEIESFFQARAAQESFTWTPPDEAAGGVNLKWICSAWTKSIPYKDRATINATFRQVFEP